MRKEECGLDWPGGGGGAPWRRWVNGKDWKKHKEASWGWECVKMILGVKHGPLLYRYWEGGGTSAGCPFQGHC